LSHGRLELSYFLFMSIGFSSFFALVRSDFFAFSLFSAGHLYSFC